MRLQNRAEQLTCCVAQEQEALHDVKEAARFAQQQLVQQRESLAVRGWSLTPQGLWECQPPPAGSQQVVQDALHSTSQSLHRQYDSIATSNSESQAAQRARAEMKERLHAAQVQLNTVCKLVLAPATRCMHSPTCTGEHPGHCSTS